MTFSHWVRSKRSDYSPPLSLAGGKDEMMKRSDASECVNMECVRADECRNVLVCQTALWLSTKHASWESHAVIDANISSPSFPHLVIFYLFVLSLCLALPFNVSVFEMKRQECSVTEVVVLLQQYPLLQVQEEKAGSLLRCTAEMPESGASQWKRDRGPPLHLTLTFVWNPDCIQIRLIQHSIYSWH